jgi:DNA topoisomerase II
MTSNVQYTVKNDIQHVLDCSDVYIGDTGSSLRKEYVYSDKYNKIIYQDVSVPEALVRIFVEVLTNAVDNVERSKKNKPCKTIKVDVDLKTGLTSVWNDGVVIPVIKVKNQNQTNEELNIADPESNSEEERAKLSELYIHSLIFGHLRSSSNYGNEEVRELSGKNGVGVKCTNIFSSYFCVTGVDPVHKLKLVQEWTRNMTKTTEPKIKPCSSTVCGYTEIKYIPDFKRFNLSSYPKEIYSMFKKLVIDVSALLPQTDFWFCDEKLLVKNLTVYSKLYYSDDENLSLLSLKYKGSDVLIVGSETYRQPVSFVNGQITKDGQHVQSWTKTIYSNLLETLNKKKELKLTKSDILPYFQFFIHSRVNKPKFDGQNKNVLKNPKVESHLEKVQLNKILKWPVITIIKNKVLRNKELLALKKIEGVRRTVIKVDGYDPANKLGTDSILIVCEGLSAKSYAVAGIQTGIFGKKGRNYFGILPLRGKFLNVKNATITKIGSNKVVSDLIKVFNLKFNVDYSKQQNYETLNYGTLLILTDADKDGIHIKGLILNFFHELFPTLFKREKFVISMETPIVKIFQKKGKDLLFYDENTFENYKLEESTTMLSQSRFKYYKGLGTINPKDVSLFFGKKLVKYNYTDDDEHSINKVFKDENANDRKVWLSTFNPRVSNYCLDTLPEIEEKVSQKDNVTAKLINIQVSNFMDHEMIKFSYEDCKRSLASCVDGLKESQRKVIYAIRKKFKSIRKTDSIKVAQLSGYVAEQTDYKHGEQNLCETIIKFAQDFVGTNNIPLLEADGQFGTRLEGGKDSADSRYIYTKPKKILKYIFREEDDPILNYTSEGEPTTFIPVIPLILVNGSVGIGTGWSCSIPQYDPRELVDHLCAKLADPVNNTVKGCLDIDPYYRNFKGKIKPVDENKQKYMTYGKMKRINERTIQVTELPVGMWTDKFKDHCYSLIEEGVMSRLVNESTIDEINFTLKDLKDTTSIKLTSTLHTTNMVLFNQHNVISKYEKINDIIEEYFEVRLYFYKLRKNHLLIKLKEQIALNKNKLKFILKVVNDENFLKQEEPTMINVLEGENFLKVDNTFNYLLNIPVRGCTLNAVEFLKNTISNLKYELVILTKLTIHEMWLKELNELRPYLEEQY